MDFHILGTPYKPHLISDPPSQAKRQNPLYHLPFPYEQEHHRRPFRHALYREAHKTRPQDGGKEGSSQENPCEKSRQKSSEEGYQESGGQKSGSKESRCKSPREYGTRRGTSSTENRST